ncbi:hypothetical protein CPC08DRAFT_600673, partial [Agrocybe pediades]
KSDWYFDTATTSHICTVLVNFMVDGKTITHRLREVLHIPDAANCLLSGTQIDDAGGEFSGGNGRCTLKDKSGNVIGTGVKRGRLYLLNAIAQLHNPEKANFTNATSTQTWDQWH